MSNKLSVRDQAYSAGQIDRWRAKLQVGQAIESLNKAAAGKIEASTSRMKAIEIILRKTLPDLASVELTSGSAGVMFTWGVPTVEGTIINMTAAQNITDNGAIQPTINDTVIKSDISDTRDKGVIAQDNNGPVSSPDDNPQ